MATETDTTDYGFDSSSGFTYPSLTVINEEKLEKFKDTYGTGFSDDATNSMWRNAQIESEREYKVWQMLAMMYDYQTLSGAEDIYLDDIFNRSGIYRKDATAAAGYAVIESDDSISTSDEIDDSYSFSNDDGDSFAVSESSTFGALVTGLYITADDLPDTATNYTITITNVSDISVSQTVTATGISSSSSDTTILNFFEDIASACESVSDGDSDDIFTAEVNTDLGVILYVGYSSDGVLAGISDPLSITFNNALGLKASKFYVTCTDTGYLSVVAGNITSVTPSDSGFNSVTNLDTFSTGTDVESDAAFRVRYQVEVGSAGAGTKSALIKAVLSVDDVTSCVIKDNPSNTDEDYAPARTFNTIVRGGEDADIAQAISDNKPIGAQTYGSSSYAVTQADNNLETIYFTRAETQQLYLKIVYETISGVSLTTGEKSDIEDAIQDLVDTFTIAGTVFMFNFSAAIVEALSDNRLSDLDVYYSTDNETWLTSNFIPDYYVIPTIDVDTGITYQVATDSDS